MSQSPDLSNLRSVEMLGRLVIVPFRDQESAARGRRKFLESAKSMSLTFPRNESHRRGVYSLNEVFPLRTARARLVALFLFLVLIFGGTGATVYAAQETLPEAPLYPVKILGEDAYLAVTIDPTARLDLVLEFADRRVDEITKLNLQEKVPPDSVTLRLNEELDEALTIVSGMSDISFSPSLARVEAAIQRQSESLVRIQARMPEPSRPTMARVSAMIQESAKLIQQGRVDSTGFRQKVNEKKQTVPSGQVHPSSTPSPDSRRPTELPRGKNHRP